MKKTIEIKSVFGKILFEHEGENNTIRKTLVAAKLRDADLRGADLVGANLRDANLRADNLEDADLRCADLVGAKLRDANLRGADLRGADLRCADLVGAKLRYADLRGADLVGADLRGAYLVGAKLRYADLPMYCKWGHSIKDNLLKIGCVSKTIEEWKQWLKSDGEFETKRGTQEFKQIEAVIRAYIAYYETLN